MPKLLRPIYLLAATSVALAMSAHRAQGQIETFQTLTSYNGSAIIGFTGGNTALAQTFNDVLELQSVTFRITNTGTDSGSQNFAAYIVQWNTATGQASPLSTFTAPTNPNATLVSGANPTDVTSSEPATPFETFTVPPVGDSNSYGSWATDTFQSGGNYNGFDVTLNFDQYTDPSLTYGIILVDTTDASGLGLLDVNSNPDAFTYGYGLQDQGDSTLTAMENDPGGFYGIGRTTADYGFSQIVVVPAGNIVPTPEPRTAALALCLGFVAFLAGRRLLKKDEAALGGALPA